MKKILLFVALFIAVTIVTAEAKSARISLDDLKGKKVAVVVLLQNDSCYLWGEEGNYNASLGFGAAGDSVYIAQSKQQGRKFEKHLGNIQLETIISQKLMASLPQQIPDAELTFLHSSGVPLLPGKTKGKRIAPKVVDFSALASEGDYDYILYLEIVDYGLIGGRPKMVIQGFIRDAKSGEQSKDIKFYGEPGAYKMKSRQKEEWLADDGKLFRDAMEKYATILASELPELFK